MNKQYLKWEDIEVLVDILYKKIQSDLQPINSIHGLKRGGYIPAVMLSHKLKLPYSEVVHRDTLIVDDICDSGETLENAPGLYHAVLHYKSHTSSFIPTIWSQKIGDEWIVYPWERDDSRTIQDYKI